VACLRLPLYELSGSFSDTDIQGKIMVAGSPDYYKYWLNLLFRDHRQVDPVGTTSLNRMMSRDLEENAMLLMPSNPWLAAIQRSRGWYIVPKWVDAYLDFESAAEAYSKVTRTLRQELRDETLTCTSTGDEGAVKRFYREMYKPTLEERHASEAIHWSEEGIRQLVREGSLLLLHKEGEEVAGGIAVHLPNAMWFAVLGWRHGDQSLLDRHIVGHLFKAALDYAGGQGFTSVNFGGSRAFALDGVLRYKMKWKMRLKTKHFEERGGQLWGPVGHMQAARFNLDHDFAQQALHKHPVLVETGTGLGALGWGLEGPSHFKHMSGFSWIDLGITRRHEVSC
jgi:hypothetical protein